jgi:dTMP kinase
LIDQPAEIGLGRLKSKDRLEVEPIDFHERIRQEYLQLTLLDPERYLVVDGRQTIEEIHQAIIARVGEIPGLRRNIRDAQGNRIMKPIRRAATTARNTARKTVKKK